MLEVLSSALELILTPEVLGIILLSAAYGIFVGSIPGLTATMAVALMVPLTFFLSDIQALAAIVTTVTCSIFAGDIPATLVRIPGTPASAAYASDAYALTQRGQTGRSLGISLIFSVFGGLFGTLVLIFAAPLLARIAENFSSFEYFWLYLLGLTCAAVVSDDSRLKGALALLIGLLLSTIGLGADYGEPRLTFGFDQLITGINFIPAMIGLFGVSELLRNALTSNLGRPADEIDGEESTTNDQNAISTVIKYVVPMSIRRVPQLIRSSVIGSLIGMLPGAGADIAAWISYAVSKRFSAHPEKYGRGSEEGLADATGANNAALGSAWIPALVFGIPGDSVTAIAIGVLLMKNIQPGPDIFDLSKPQAVLVFGIYITFILANLLLIPLGLIAIRAGTLLVHIPRNILIPAIVIFCIVGSFSLNASYFDVTVMLVMGILGFLLERLGAPLGPVVLGIILGGALEHKFIQCLTKSNSPLAFLSSPISWTLAICCLSLWAWPLIFSKRRRSSVSGDLPHE
ncbi:MAG: tripartite tricarboxylate transporter permease [Pirellulaceae bacterium]|nr:tripartite tricarboxylate transporter permease [Pirellulaceae bacterium]